MNTKGVSVLTADIKATKAENGTYDITLSIPELDRDDEVIDAKALQWKTSGRMPVDVDHGMTVLTTVGSGVPVYEGDDLKLADFRFASTAFAQDVKILVDEEHVSKMSVTFMAAQREKDKKDGKMHVRSAELLNAAIVPIPSNREANILVGKALAALAEKTGQPLGQSVARKAIVGSYEERADNLREALRAANANSDWLWVRATFDDQVVYEVESNGVASAFQVTYESTDDGFTFGEPTAVDIAEVVVAPKTAAADPEEKAAAPAAANPPADVVALPDTVRARVALAEATLLLTS